MHDLERLRRFALAIGLVALTYSLGGVELETDSPLSILGIPFTVTAPNLLLRAALALGCAYGGLRYGYYAFWVAESPRARREVLLSHPERKRKQPQGRIAALTPSFLRHYFQGVVTLKFDITDSYDDVMERRTELAQLFPGTARKNIGFDAHQDTSDKWTLRVEVSKRSLRRAAWMDLDYAAPVLVDGLAVVALLVTTAFG